MSTLTTHLKVSVEQLNKDDGNEHSIDMIFEIVKVFQILGLSKDIEHRQLVLTSEVLDLVYKLFNQSKSDDIFLQSLSFYNNLLFVHIAQDSNRIIKEAIDKYDLIYKLEEMSGENNNRDKYVCKEMKSLLKTLKKPIEENIEVNVSNDENQNITEE